MSRRQSRRKLKKDIICYFLSFILMNSLIVLSVASLGTYSMFSIHGVTHSAERVDYYDYLKSELMQQAYDMAIPFGLDEVLKTKNEQSSANEETTEVKQVTKNNVEIEGIIFLDKVFSVDEIQNDVENYLKAQVEGKTYEIHTEKMEKRLYDAVKKEKKQLTSEEEQSLEAYTTQLMELYKTKIPFPTSWLLVKGIQLASKVIWFAIPISILTTLLSIFLIMSMRTATYRGLRFVAYGILGAGATLTTVCAAMISDGAIYRLNVSNAYMRRFFTFLLGHEMLMQVFSGIVMLVLGVILIYAIARLKFRGRV